MRAAMRPVVVLAVLALGLLATLLLGDGPEGSFDDRYARTQQRIQEMAAEIDKDFEKREAAVPSE